MKWNDIPSKCGGAFLPFVLICMAMIAFLYWQLKNISDQRNSLQINFMAQDAPKAQTEQVEAKLKDFALDLLQLAKSGDPDAMAIVKKYNISQQPASSPKP